MDAQKVLEVLDIYAKELPKFHAGDEYIRPERCDLKKRFMGHNSYFWKEKLNHILFAVEMTKVFVQEGRMEKAFRWLGFIQGALWYEGIYSIDDLASHNKPPEDPINHSLERRG